MPHEELYNPHIPTDPIKEWYVNTIWGNQIREDNLLFEVMSLQVFQAGLTWKMILSKRDGFRSAFFNWDVQKVANFGPSEIEQLCQTPAIIRNRLKIEGTVQNARTILSIQSEYDSFCNWYYNVLPGTDYPTLWKILHSKFKFMGPEISRMWLMAAGRITQAEGNKYSPLPKTKPVQSR